ncbi:putative membrane protein, partial [Escherichia coli EC4421]|jgi:chromosome segregation ATPase
MTLR